MTEIVDKLMQAPMFQGCDRGVLEDFLSTAHHRLRRRDTDEMIAYRGDKCDEVLLLVEGSAYSTMSGDDKEVVVEQFEGPLMLAPAFAFATKNVMPVNVTAQTPCTILYINRHDFMDLLHRDSTLMMNFIQIISNRCQRLSERLNDFAVQSLKERVMDYLQQHQRIDNVGWLSRVLGVARPSLSRVLSELKAEGVIERTIDGIELKKGR